MQDFTTVQQCVRTLYETIMEEDAEGGDGEKVLSAFLVEVIAAAQLDGSRGSRSSALEVLQMADRMMNGLPKELTWEEFIADADEVTMQEPVARPVPELLSHEEPVPSVEQLQEWMQDGGCEATDGCWVEIDGSCPHGKLSWYRVLIG